MKDISKQKSLEGDLVKEKEKFHLLAEKSPLGIALIGPGNRYDYFNPKFKELFGYTPEEISTGRDWLEMAFPDLDYRIQVISTWKKDKKEVGIGQARARIFKIRCKDGSEKWISINSVFMEEDNHLIMYEDVTDRHQAEEEVINTLEKLRKAMGGIIQVISQTVEMRDPYTAGHQRRVSELARAIAQVMGLSMVQVDGLRMAGVIHDLGKISVPAEILSKPTRLTDLEFGLIKLHAGAGYEILRDIEFPWPIARMVLEHHERINGSGYPQGLKGEEILLESRILAVADVVEAIATHRPYRPAHGIEVALEEISKNKGILYDAEVVEACLQLFMEKGFKLE